MRSCEHSIVLCKFKNCKECEYAGLDISKCPLSKYVSEDEKIPTFNQMLKIYDGGESSYRRKKLIRSYILSDLKTLGLDGNSKANELTKPMFKTLMASFRDEKRIGGPLRDSSIESRLGAFRAISSRWLEDRYEEMGLEIPHFNIPVFRVNRPPVQQVSDKQVRLFTIQMEKWLASGRPCDRDAFVYSWFALFCGMRAGDICLNRWDVLKRTDDGIMVAYEPHKTAKYHKVTAFYVDHKVWCMIEPLVGKPDEYIIPRHDNRIPKSGVGANGCGEYKFMHVYLRKKVNRAIERCGIGTEYPGQKKTHALRKYFETEMAMKFGKMVAAKMACHSLRQQENSYLGNPYGKVVG